MTFPIDIVALDRHNVVLGLWGTAGPWRVYGLSFKTRSILELAPGAIDRSSTRVGDQVQVSTLE